jgi:hypothetical protein
VFALGLANAVGMSVIGVLLVLAVRRHAGSGALAGLGRATAAGMGAAAPAGLAGWAVVRGVTGLSGATPAGVAGLLQGMLGGVVVLVVFGAVAYVLDRHDVQPLTEVLRRRLGRRRAVPPPPGPSAGVARPGHPGPVPPEKVPPGPVPTRPVPSGPVPSGPAPGGPALGGPAPGGPTDCAPEGKESP